MRMDPLKEADSVFDVLGWFLCMVYFFESFFVLTCFNLCSTSAMIELLS
jgi:hypothetical protein